MTGINNDISPRAYARIAGILYLLIIAGGLFAEGFVRQQLFVYGDATATAANILAQEQLFRAGFAVHLFYLLCAVPVSIIFYGLFKRVNGNLALLMLAFNIVAITVESVVLLNQFAPLRFLGTEAPGGLAPEQLDALGYVFLRLFSGGFGISLVFFGCFCLVIGYLICTSGLLPGVIGVLMAVAGICYLVNSFSLFIAPDVANLLFPWILLPSLVAELSLASWLAVVGIRGTEPV